MNVLKKSFLSILTAAFLLLGFVLPVHAAESVTISFTTNAETYKQSETISVTGTVLKGTKAGTGTNPTMQVKNSSGKTVETYQWKDTQISSNGSISTTINPKKYVDDTYTVRLSASGAIAVTKTIVISGEEIPTTPKPDPTPTPDPGTTTPDPGTTTPDPGTTTPDPGTTTPDPGTPTPNPGTTKPEPSPTQPPGDIIPKPPVNPTPVPDPTVKPNAPKVNQVTTVSTVITGTADAGTTVIISDRKNFRVWADANSSGVFSIALSEKLKAGMKLYATAKARDNESDTTELVVLDATPPAAPSVNKVSDRDTKVMGSAEVGSTITIKAGNKTLATGTAVNGLFSIKITSQKAGTILSITVKDAFGNISSTKKITVLDKTAPKSPTVSKVTDQITRVTGTSEAGAKMTIKSGKKLLGSGTADKKGKFSIKIKLQKAGTVLAVTAADQAGNVSKSKTVKVLDKTAPKAPSVNAVKKTATKVTGKAEAGSKVYVKVGKKVIGSATVSKKGTYSVKIKKQKAGTKVAVYAKDQGGNTGKTKTVTVKK